MKPEDLMEALGDIDDKYIKKAKEKKRKHIGWVIGTLAACFIIVIALPFIGIALTGVGADLGEPPPNLDETVERPTDDMSDLPLGGSIAGSTSTLPPSEDETKVTEKIVRVTVEGKNSHVKFESEEKITEILDFLFDNVFTPDSNKNSSTEVSENWDFDSELVENEYSIIIYSEASVFKTLRLYENNLYYFEAHCKYVLTDEQTNTLKTILEIS